MGYTRYWNAIDAKDLSSRDVAKFVKMAQRAADIAKDKYGLKLASWDGTGEPEISTSQIVFNGDSQNSEDCESFILLDGKKGFNFTKTEELPYDMLVGAILTIAADCGIVTKVTSDGPSKYEEEAWYIYLMTKYGESKYARYQLNNLEKIAKAQCRAVLKAEIDLFGGK